MAGQPPVVSAPFVVTEAAASPSIALTGSPSTEPASGGTVSLSGTTNLPDGSAIELYLNGQDTGVGTVSSGGAFSFPSQTIPPNATLGAVEFSYTAQYTPPAPPA